MLKEIKGFKKIVSVALVFAIVAQIAVQLAAVATTKDSYAASINYAADEDWDSDEVTLATLLSSSDPVVAENSAEILEIYELLSSMSVSELNEFISDEVEIIEEAQEAAENGEDEEIEDSDEAEEDDEKSEAVVEVEEAIAAATEDILATETTKSTAALEITKLAASSSAPNLVGLKALWMAAAAIAYKKGYTCSATLVNYSVLGKNYTETKGSGGLFHDKIVKTTAYKTFLRKVKNKTYPLNEGQSVTIPKSQSSDLYYAIHTATYTPKKSGSNYKISIYDKFDFDLMLNKNAVFTSFVNDWALLCQYANVLDDIDINISFVS